MSVVADNLRHFADRAGLDSAALAARTRIPAADLARFLDGTAWPCPRTQARLAAALGVTTADLHAERE